ncbi:MAG: putative [lipopolysaccharide]-lipid A 3-O-deacylase outer membrane protein, PagL family [Nitrospira sp.]
MTRPRRGIIAFILLLTAGFTPSLAQTEESGAGLRFGTQEVGFTAGYLISVRLTSDHSTKQQGPALMPSWSMVLTDPIGKSWYQGQILLGAEIVYIQFQEPVLTHGIGFTPKIKYLFSGYHSFRPYIEFAGGPFYTDLVGYVPEESARLNFLLTAGVGLSWFVTPRMALNAGYRFQHISNAGTRYPNVGLNASLPFIGFSFYF